MPTALAAADLAVCRSGSSTCFELAAAGLPSILVPSPFVTADQQTGNAAPPRGRRRRRPGARRRARRRPPGGRGRRASSADAGAPRGDGAPPPGGWARPTRPTPSPRSPRSTPVAEPDARPRRRRRRIHVTNVGGAGMSAVATLLAEMGHTVTGHDPSADSPFLAPLARPRRRGRHRAGPPDAARRRRRRRRLHGHPGRPPARRRRPGARASPVVAPVRGARPRSARRRRHGGRGRHPRQDHDLGAARHDPGRGAARAPGWVVGAGIAGPRAQRGVGRRRARSWWRPTRATAPSSPSAPRRPSSPTSSPTTSSTGAARPSLRAAFVRFVAALPGPAVLCVDDPGAARAGRRTRPTPVTYGTDAGGDYRIDGGRRRGHRACAFDLVHGDERVAGGGARPPPGVHNARNAAGGPGRSPTSSACRWPTAAAALGRLPRAWPAASRCGARRAASLLVDSYDHLPTEVAAALAAARAGRWRRVVCCFQPHRYSRTEALGRTFADAFDDADVLAVTDVYPAGEAPRPGVTGKLVVDAVLDAHPWQQVAWLPDPRRRGRLPRRHAAARATCASPSAPATSPPCPTALLAAPRGRGDVSEPAVIDAAADRLGALAERDVPLGPAHHLPGRRARRAAGPRSRTRTTCARSSTAGRRRPASTCSWSGKGSQPARGRRRLPGPGRRARRRASPRSRSTAPTVRGRRGGGAARGGPPHRRRRAHRLRVGGRRARARSAAAVRMNAGGHGSDMAAVARAGSASSTCAAGRMDGCPPPRSTSATARSVGGRRTRSWWRPTWPSRPATPSAGAARAGRDRGLAAGQPARGPQRRLGVHQPAGDSAGRLIDAAGGKGRRRGTAAVSTKHANFIQADDGGRADDVYALMARGAGAWSRRPRGVSAAPGDPPASASTVEPST